MEITLHTENLPASELQKVVEAVAAEAVRTVGDLLQTIAQAQGEASLPMGIFAKALLNDNKGLGPLEINDADEHKKGIKALDYLAKGFCI